MAAAFRGLNTGRKAPRKMDATWGEMRRNPPVKRISAGREVSHSNRIDRSSGMTRFVIEPTEM